MGSETNQFEAFLADPLTRREIEVLSLLADGLSNREIAETLTLTLSTVKWYTKQIYSKLGVNSRKSAVDHARELGLLGDLSSLYTLPSETTKLFGREDELRKVTGALKDPGCRLLTVMGLGGVGKTRLALRVATEFARQESSLFKDGIHFIPLAAHDDASRLPSVIAGVLNFPLSGAEEPFEQLVNYWRNKQILLVLDNFEQLLDGSEEVARLLQRTTGIKVLVTTREALNLREEWRFELTGLPLPDLSNMDLLRNGAVQLFIERASQVRPDFSKEGNVGCIAQICRLVVGMPLAIELAATWIRSLSCHEIAGELESNLENIETSLRNVPERHQSMWVVLDQSWSRLSQAEKDVCQSLAVFTGGFSLSAAKSVTGASPRILTSLIDKSMVRRDRADHYQMHDLVKKYAAERLARNLGTEQEVRDRHSSFFSALAASYQSSWGNHNQLLALKVFKQEIHNLLQAWRRNLEQANYEQLDQMVFSICEFFYWQGRLDEGKKICRQLLEAVSKSEQDPPSSQFRVNLLRSQALLWESILIIQSQNTTLAKERIDAAQEILASINTRDSVWSFVQAHVWLQKGRTAVNLGELDEATNFLNQSLSLFLELQKDWGAAASWYWLGMLAWLRENDEASRDAYQQSLSLFLRTGDRRNIASLRDALASSLRHMEQWDGVVELHLEAIATANRLKDPLRVGWMNHNLTWTYFEIGEFKAGAETGQECISVAEEIGNEYILAAGQGCSAACLLHLGQYAQAKVLAETSYSKGLKGVIWQPFVPITIGEAALAMGHLELADQMISEGSHFLLANRPSRASIPLSSLVLVSLGLNKLEDAEGYLKKALSLAIKSKKQMQLAQALVSAATLSSTRGDQSQALDLLQLAFLLPHFSQSKWYADVTSPYFAREFNLVGAKAGVVNLSQSTRSTIMQAATEYHDSLD